MPDITSIRQQYPQYGDMSDDQLASALHQKFYSDMPEDQFRQKIGLQKPESSLVNAFKDIGSAVARPLAEAVTWPQLTVENAAVQAYDRITGKPVSKEVLPSQTFEQNLNKVTRKPTTTTGQVAEDISSMIAAPGLAPEKGAAAGIQAVEKIAPEALERAQKYVVKLGLDWDKLGSAIKQKLTAIAKEATGLDKLDPKAVQRVARAQAVGAPITRGQATRDVEQITHEENLTRSASGKPLRDVSSQQDTALHKKLGEVRTATGGKAETSLQLGASVQGAERAKLRSLQASKRLKYSKARQSGELQTPVDPTPLQDWLSVPANERNAGWLKSALKDYTKVEKGTPSKSRAIVDSSGKPLATTPGTPGSKSMTINDLEEIRKEANVKVGSSDLVEAHYAKEAVKQIDDILDKSGGDVYKEARASHRAEKSEFDRQTLIKKLTSERTRTTDRAVALEDTFDTTVRRGSNEQLQQLRKSLLEGGTSKTRLKGQQAWKDIQGATVDYLKEAAAGKRGIPGEDEQLEFRATFVDAFDELDKDGKLDVLFGKEAKGILKQIRDATVDLRTKPSTRIAGSDTTPRLIAMLDKLSLLPGVGKVIGGIGKKIGELHALGGESRAVKEAMTPIKTTAAKVKESSSTIGALRSKAVPASALTLQDWNNE